MTPLAIPRQGLSRCCAGGVRLGDRHPRRLRPGGRGRGPGGHSRGGAALGDARRPSPDGRHAAVPAARNVPRGAGGAAGCGRGAGAPAVSALPGGFRAGGAAGRAEVQALYPRPAEPDADPRAAGHRPGSAGGRATSDLCAAHRHAPGCRPAAVGAEGPGSAAHRLPRRRAAGGRLL